MPAQLTFCISGGGSNLKAVIDAIANQSLNAEIACVIADRQCAGIEHAFAAGLNFVLIDRKLEPKRFNAEFIHAAQGSDWIVLAGFLTIISTEIVEHFPKKIINLHPSLLPAYGGKGMYGKHVHQAVIAAGERETGASIHYVDGGIDTGAIIAQTRLAVLPQDTPASLQARLAPYEHQLLIQTLSQLVNPHE